MPRFSLKGLADKSGLNTNVDTNPILRYLAMVTPFVLEVILIWVAGTLSIWHLLLAVGLAVAFLILVGPFFFQEFSATSPFTFGHVAGAIFIHLILYYKYIVPATRRLLPPACHIYTLDDTLLLFFCCKPSCTVRTLSGPNNNSSKHRQCH